MKLHGIRQATSSGVRARGNRKFKTTADSAYGLPVVEELLNRELSPAAPGRVWASEKICAATDEGGLYLVGVIDLYSGQWWAEMQLHMGRQMSSTHCEWHGLDGMLV